jgi:hypothetical protein
MSPIENSTKHAHIPAKQNTDNLKLKPDSLDALLNRVFPPVRWTIEGLLPSEGLTIISAAPGSYKTWLMLEMALSIAQGIPLFGKYPTNKAGVLIVDEESGPRMLNERFRKLGATSGLPILYFSRLGRKVDRDFIELLQEICDESNIGVVIFDSLVRFHQGDENASRDMSELFNSFKLLADKGRAVLIAHHNRKSMPGNYNPSGDMRGSGDILAAIDCHIAVSRNRNSDYIDVLQTKNRYIQELRPFKLRFSTDADRFQFEFIRETKTIDDRHQDLKGLIVTHLEKNTQPTQIELLDELISVGVEIKTVKLRTLLHELVAEGAVKTKPGTRNASHYYIPLADKEDAS